MDKYKGFERLYDYETERDSKSRIINSAIYMFASKGYLQTTTKSIADLAEVSEALLFKYYGNKQKLLGAVSLEILNNRLPMLFKYRFDELLNPELLFTKEMFLHILKEKFRYVLDHVGYIKIVFLELHYNSEETRDVLKGMINGFFNQLEVFIKRLQSQGKIRKDIPPRTILRSISGNLGGLMLDLNMLETTLDIDYELEIIVEILFKGVGENE